MFYANNCVTLRKTKQNDKVFSLLKNYIGAGPLFFWQWPSAPNNTRLPVCGTKS